MNLVIAAKCLYIVISFQEIIKHYKNIEGKMYFKKISSMFLMLLIITFTGCKKDDNPVVSAGAELVGTWSLTKIYVTALGGIPVDPAEYGISATFIMRSDKTFSTTYTYSNTTDTDSGTWSAANGKIALKNDAGETEELPYQLQGNKLTVDTILEIPGFGQQPVKMEFTKQ